ncbi:MAG TPA: DUF1360 domain-containing protein [Chloroflexota bacterium]|nr:DUF1360 domain-containing protein [Chloroflexota bacterium]
MKSLLYFLLLGGVNHQITIIVVESLLFRGFRQWLVRRSRWLGELVRCHLCFGMWVGFFMALIFRPRFVDVPPVPGASPGIDRGVQALATFVGDACAIAVGGRIFNELLGIARREVGLLEEETELVEEEREMLEHGGAR